MQLFKFMGGPFPDISDDELTLRRKLFLTHTPVCQTYCDDGELQDSTCNIDFRRDSVEEIQRCISNRRLLDYVNGYYLNGDKHEEHYC